MTQHCVSCKQWCNAGTFWQWVRRSPAHGALRWHAAVPAVAPCTICLTLQPPLHHLHHSFLCATLACNLPGGGSHHVEGAYRSRTSLLSLLLGKLLPKCHVALHTRCLEHSLTKNPETPLLSLLLGKLLPKHHVAHWATRSSDAALCMSPAEMMLKNSAKLLEKARRCSPRAMGTPTKIGMLLGLGRQQGMCGCT